MPMFTTLRMRLPVAPRHSPLRTALAKPAMRSRTAWTSGTTFCAVDLDPGIARRPQRHMQNGAPFGRVDLLAAEHGIAPFGHTAFLGKSQQQLHRLLDDEVLRVVQEQPVRLGREALRAPGVVGEQPAKRRTLHLR